MNSGSRRHPAAAIVVDEPRLAAAVLTIIERDQAAVASRPATMAELERHSAGAAFDVAVVSAGSTRRERYAAFAQARAVAPHTPLVGIWPGDEPAEHRRALRAGIDGLVTESRLETALGATIRAALHGLACVPGWTGRRPPPVELSSREKQIVGMAILGISNEEASRRLGLSESTVKGYLSSAYAKLGVHSRAAAAAVILDPEGNLATKLLTIPGE